MLIGLRTALLKRRTTAVALACIVALTLSLWGSRSLIKISKLHARPGVVVNAKGLIPSFPVHAASLAPQMEISTVVHHGRIIEVKGSTDPGVVLMINGEPAVTFFDGNKFRHFLGPMPPGVSIISITAQNDQGGVTTKQLAVTTE